MKILITPDSFKGTLTSLQAAEIISKPFLERNHNVVLVPVADGGEGTVDAFLYSTSAEKKIMKVRDPLSRPIDAYYGYKNDNAFIEIAQSSGITLLKKEELNPLKTTTYGFGELIKDACDSGFKNIYLGLGGTATNDAGAGMLSALGIKFKDKNGEIINKFLNASHLPNITGFDDSELKRNIGKVKFTALCDVKNPLTGKTGASLVYSFQKGADENTAKLLDEYVKYFSDIIRKRTGKEPEFPGAGAAGGVASALKIFLNAEIVSGIEGIIELLGLEEKIKDCDIVIVGEGSLDSQSAFGKAPVGIARLAKKYGKPVIAVSGKVGKDAELLFSHGIDSIFSCYPDVSVDMNLIKLNTVSDITKLSIKAAESITALSDIKNKIFILNET